jgi:hypothetical protein
MRHIFAMAVVSSLLLACGGDTDTDTGKARTVSCLFANEGACDTVVGVMTDGALHDLEVSCTVGQGTFAVGACSTVGTVPGCCHSDLGGGRNRYVHYLSSTWTDETAREDCDHFVKGTWVP